MSSALRQLPTSPYPPPKPCFVEHILTTAVYQALDEEAEVLVKKLWRMIIFFSESEKRGLSA